MKKSYSSFILTFLFTVLSTVIIAQNVGISDVAITPDASSMLEVRSTTKGMLMPRVSLTQTTSASPVTSPATSLLVYNTATVNDVTPGFYYWSGTAWVRLLSGTVPSSGWALTGNAGTNPASNFLGTTDAQDLVIRTNNTEKFRVQSGGNVGIGTSAPSQKLDVSGAIRFSSALMPNGSAGTSGQVLVSQGAGAAPIWQNPTSIPMYGNNAHSVSLNALVTNTDQINWANIPGMSITFTPTHTSFYIFASLCARLADNSGMAQFGQALIQSRILVNGVEVAKAASIITDFDEDSWGGMYVLTSGSVAFSGIKVNSTIGLPTTVVMQWKPILSWASSPWRVEINPTNASVADHCVLTVFD
jgi:hypothetical protein